MENEKATVDGTIYSQSVNEIYIAQSEALWTLDLDHNFDISQEIFDILGRSPVAGFTLDNFYAYLPPKSEKRLKKAVREMLKHPISVDEKFSIVDDSGQQKHIRITAKFLPTSKILAGTVADTTPSELHHLNRDFEYLFNLSSDLFASIGDGGYLDKINPSWESFTGMSLHELLDRPLTEFIHPDDRDLFMQTFESVWESSAQLEDCITRIIHHDGSYHWISWSAQSVPNSKKVYFSGKDVNNRIEDNISLEESNQKVNDILENLPVPILIVNVHGNEIMYANQPLYRLLEIENEDKESLHNFLYLTRNLADIFKRGIIVNNHEISFTTFKKNEVYALTSLHKTQLGSQKAIIIAMRDITARKKTELDLKQSRDMLNKLALITQETDNFIMLLNKKGRIQWVNSSFLSFYGFRLEQIIDQPPDFLWSPGQPNKTKKIKNHLEANKSTQLWIRTLTSNGTTATVDVDLKPIFNDHGHLMQTALILRDITFRIRQQKAIAQRNRELKKTNRELDNFVYKVSHDLRAPVASSIGLTHIMRDEKDPEKLMSYTELLSKSMYKLDEFIKSILDHSRNSRLSVQIDKIDFKNEVLEINDSLKYSYQESLDLRVDIQNQGREFYSDPYRIRIILNNMISNAYRYLDLQKSSHYLKISLQILPEHFILTFSDNGIGIEDEHLQRIFDMFYRATDRNHGSGLGLYIVKDTVDKLKGTIEVKSVFREGTRFHIQIPHKTKD